MIIKTTKQSSTTISFYLILCSFLCSLIAYYSYWYKKVILHSVGSTSIYYKYRQLQTVSRNTDGYIIKKETTNFDHRESNKNEMDVYLISLVFDLVAVILFFFSTLITYLETKGFWLKNNMIIKNFGKFAPVIGTVFVLVSPILFLNLPNATMNDCIYTYGDFCGDLSDYAFTLTFDDFYRSPSIAWYAAILSSCFGITAIVINAIRRVF